ncbi:MAG: DM13 domain-containing protein [Cyanophyceae cyanobacterium]
MKRSLLSGLSLLFLATAVSCATEQKAITQTLPEPTQTISQAEATVLREGTFQDGEHPTSGTVRLVQENEQPYLEFGSDFQTDSGPDLFVILHRSNDVIGNTSPPAHSIAEGDYVTIAPLETVNGTQRYAIPEGVNLDEYQSVAVWCRQFNATFGAASLNE